MAKKKTYKKRKKTTRKTASKIDLTVVVLIVVSILLAVLIYGKSGVIGLKLNEIFGRYDGNYKVCFANWNICISNKYCM